MTDKDIESVLQIWLGASLKAHHFISASYWQDELQNMREVYLPSAVNYIYKDEGLQIKGFISLCDDNVAALFVDPASQGLGIGKQLLAKAKSLNKQLSLNVYEQNTDAVGFYEKQGFVRVKKQLDNLSQHDELLMCWYK